MAKQPEDKTTTDAFAENTYIASVKYVHENGTIRSGQVAVQARDIEEARQKAHNLAKETWDKFKFTSIKLW